MLFVTFQSLYFAYLFNLTESSDNFHAVISIEQNYFTYVSFDSTDSGMNLNQRELTQHVEYEPETYYAAFSAELEICASPMWSQLVHCKEQVRRTFGLVFVVRTMTRLSRIADPCSL